MSEYVKDRVWDRVGFRIPPPVQYRLWLCVRDRIGDRVWGRVGGRVGVRVWFRFWGRS